MVLFKSNIEDKSWHLAFVINQPENQNLDLIKIYLISIEHKDIKMLCEF
jgi:hypothetical protein